MIRVVGILLPHKREDDVIGIEIAGGREIFVDLECHPFAQVEGIALAVLAHFPAFRQAGLQLDGAGFEVHQPVVNRRRAGVHRGAGGEQLRVEAFRRAFGTVDQRIGPRATGYRQRQQPDRYCFSLRYPQW